MKRLISGTLLACLSRVPPSWLIRAEDLLARGRGVGWGTATVDIEARACVNLLRRHARLMPVALDVGANSGAWTEALLKCAPRAQVYAFEPSKAAFERLSRKLGGESNVTLINRALAKDPGRRLLWADAPGSGLASLDHRDLSHLGIPFDWSEEVEAMTLDDWASERGITPDLIKLDVEGSELEVLLGGAKTLRHAQVVQFEFGGCNIDSRTFLRDFYRFFSSQGFELYRLSPGGLQLLDRYRETDEAFRTTNLYAAR